MREEFVLGSHGLPNDTYELFNIVISLYAKTNHIGSLSLNLHTN